MPPFYFKTISACEQIPSLSRETNSAFLSSINHEGHAMPPCRPSLFTSSKARCRIKRRVFRAPHELNKSLISAIWSFVPSNLSITICLRKVCWKSSAESSWKVPVSHSSDVPDDNAKNCKWHVKLNVNEHQYGYGQQGNRSVETHTWMWSFSKHVAISSNFASNFLIRWSGHTLGRSISNFLRFSNLIGEKVGWTKNLQQKNYC